MSVNVVAYSFIINNEGGEKMPKIYLSPAYHKWNPCSIEGCDETTHNNMYLDELEKYLKACNIEFKRGPRRVPKSTEDSNAYIRQAVRESNAYKPDVHYVSHTNAANTKVRGYRPMIFPGSAKAKALADIIIEKRREIYNQPITLNTRTDLYELKATTAPAYYEEHVFHDNINDAMWFHDNMRNIARQTCKAFCQYFGIAFVDPYEEKSENQTSAQQISLLSDLFNKIILVLKKLFGVQ